MGRVAFFVSYGITRCRHHQLCANSFHPQIFCKCSSCQGEKKTSRVIFIWIKINPNPRGQKFPESDSLCNICAVVIFEMGHNPNWFPTACKKIGCDYENYFWMLWLFFSFSMTSIIV